MILITASKYSSSAGTATGNPVAEVQMLSQSGAHRIRWIELMHRNFGCSAPLWQAIARLPERDTVPQDDSSAPPLDDVTSFGVLEVSVNPTNVTCGIKSHVSAADPVFVSSRTHALEAQHNTSVTHVAIRYNTKTLTSYEASLSLEEACQELCDISLAQNHLLP